MRHERVERLDGLVERRSPPGQAVAEPLERLAGVYARLGLEGGQHVLQVLGRRGGRGERDGVAGLEGARGAARHQLHVLEPQRRARANGDRRVHRQRLDALVELELKQRDRALSPVHAPARAADALDLTDPEAARTHVVSLDELGRVRELGLDAVGRDEWEPPVRAVGDEHGHEGHQHRHRPHQHRARRESTAPAAHGPRR